MINSLKTKWQRLKYWQKGGIIGFIFFLFLGFVPFFSDIVCGKLFDKYNDRLPCVLIFEQPWKPAFLYTSQVLGYVGEENFVVILYGPVSNILFGIFAGILIGLIIGKIKKKSKKFQKKFWFYTRIIFLVFIIILLIKFNQEKIENKIKEIIIDIKQPTEKPLKKDIYHDTDEHYVIEGEIFMKEISDVEIILHTIRPSPSSPNGPNTLTNIEFFLANNKVSGTVSREEFVTLKIDKDNIKIGKNNFKIIFSYSAGGAFYYSFSKSPLTIYRDTKFNADGLDAINLIKVGKEGSK